MKRLLSKARSSAQQAIDDPLVLWLVVAVLVVEGALLALFGLGVL